MKKTNYTLALATLLIAFCAMPLPALRAASLPLCGITDSIKQYHTTDEVVVTAPMHKQANDATDVASRTLLNASQLQSIMYETPHDLSSIVPNLYIPQYGSKRSTPLFIRGIGSRNGNPSASVYLEGTPILFPANINFSLPNVRSVEVLNGPQSSFYGKNTLGGIIELFTYSPFSKRATQASLSTGSFGLFKLNTLVPYSITDRFSIMAGLSSEIRNGYWINAFNGKPADALKDLSLVIKAAYRLSADQLLSLSIMEGNLQQGAFPYRGYHYDTKQYDPLLLNHLSHYQRKAFRATIQYRLHKQQLSLQAAATVEGLRDGMDMDQDYSPKDIFALQAGNKGLGVAFESIIKWHDKDEHHFLSGGLSFQHTNLSLSNDIHMGMDGVKGMLNPMLNKFGSNPKVPVQITSAATKGEDMVTRFRMPNSAASLFAEYCYNDLFVDGLSVAVGTHFGFDAYALGYDVKSAFAFKVTPKADPSKAFEVKPPVHLHDYYKQLHWSVYPHAALHYKYSSAFNTYASLSSGYRSGGYNEQLFADILLRSQIQALQAAIMKKGAQQNPDLSKELSYQPEKGTNYELGFYGSLLNEKMNWRTSFFYTQVKDLQLTDFVSSGLGRLQHNSGDGSYAGLEVQVAYTPFAGLNLSASYGYTRATLNEVMLPSGEKQQHVPVPFVPQQTLSLVADYKYHLPHKQYWVKALFIGGTADGVGPIYYTVDKKQMQPFNMMFNARAGVEFRLFSIWAKGYNLSNSQRTAFYFRSLGRTLVQTVPPARFEVGITWRPAI